MNILKYKSGWLGNDRLVYCGRPKGNDAFGLGNPFSWKQSAKAKYKVKDLAESLDSYKKFTWKLICSHNTEVVLDDFELAYWEAMKSLAVKIRDGKVDGLICWCVEVLNYVPRKEEEKKCHTQALYAACLYMIEKGIV